ncbi:hypothetical protein Ato02nite_100860 [Paractinoplanes toevensis]|uniref:Uncharacterized protein n=1 Tax=Paractinoplanes toevensis TaxID=571911 RepID=A0A920BRN8_9ACTN|nr:hypothetical protein Ato02nite_100860 [Actinoplanes toevensis]
MLAVDVLVDSGSCVKLADLTVVRAAGGPALGIVIVLQAAIGDAG